MKGLLEKLKLLDKKVISYVIGVVAVVSVLVSGITAIIDIQKTTMKTYHEQLQFVSALPVEAVWDVKCFTHEFLCVSDSMISLQVEGIIGNETTGNVSYVIETLDGTKVVESIIDVQKQKHPEYDGIWIDVSDAGLVQGERYRLSLDVKDSQNLQLFIASNGVTSGISVRQFFAYEYAFVYTIGIILFMILAVVWLYLMYKNGYGPKMYLITSLVVGVLLVLLMPPANQDDEYRHFLRAYMEVADCELIVAVQTGGESGLIGTQPSGENMIDVPYEINELRLMGYEDNFSGYDYQAERNLFLNLNKMLAVIKADPVDSIHRVAVTGVIFKKPVTSYWPQMVSMSLAQMLGTRDLFLYYVARFGQLFACLIMEVAAMKLAPKLKEMIWLLAFIPNAFLLKASCNPDGLLTSEILLLAAVIIWMKEKKINIFSKKTIPAWILFLLITYSILEMKLPYVLISAGLLLYLGKENIAKQMEWIKEHKKLSIGLAIGVVVIGVAGVVVLKDTLLGMLYQFLPLNYITYIVAHPFAILKLFAGAWIGLWLSLFQGMKGSNWLPYPIMVVGILMMLKKEQPIIKRMWFALLFGILMLVIVLVGYTLTPPDYGIIWGIGYRYVLPFMIAGCLCLPAGNDKTDVVAKQIMPVAIFVTMTSTIINYIALWSV